MAHGFPDWGQTAGTKTVYQLTDLAELAARLGSIVTFDRRGDVIWLDDFENTLNKWVVATGGTGASVALSITQARNGSTSVLLTGGSDGTRLAEIHHLQPFPVLSPMGLEFSFGPGDTGETFTLEVDFWDGTNLSRFSIRYDPVADTLSYLDANSAFVTFASALDLPSLGKLFNTMKLVFDPVSDEYVRLIFNNTTYLLTDKSAWVTPTVISPMLAIYITMISRPAFNDEVWVDDVILTQNEP